MDSETIPETPLNEMWIAPIPREPSSTILITPSESPAHSPLLKRSRAPVGEPGHEPRATRWLATLDATPREDLEWLRTADDSERRGRIIVFFKKCKFLTYQLECGEQTSRLHLQIYARTERMTLQAFKKALCPMFDYIHIDNQRYGSERAMVEYCNKEATRVRGPWTYGETDMDMKPGRRSDILEACETLHSTRSLLEVAEKHMGTYIKMHKGLESWLNVTSPPIPLTRPMTLTLIWGPPGTGKTTLAMSLASPAGEPLFSVTPGPHCWDQYNGEKALIMDEFDYTAWDINMIKKLWDKFRLILPCRYNNKYALWEHVIVISQSDPNTWYTDDASRKKYSRDDIKAVFRRIGHRCFLKEGFGSLDDCTNTPQFGAQGDLILSQL